VRDRLLQDRLLARLLRDGFVILAATFVAIRLLALEPWIQSVDAYAYWATRTGDPYAQAEAGRLGAYLYSPAFAQLLAPLVALPWPVFCALWTGVLCLVYWRLVGRLALPLLLFIPIPFEIVSGNVHLLIGAAIVAGFRYPAAWALPLLTKVTPGIGLLWFAVRREWRSLAIAAGATAAVSVVSFVVAPNLWRDWLALLVRDSGGPLDTPGWYAPIPLLVRLPVAAAVVVWGALTDRRWTVPVAVTIGLPIVWLNSLAILAALPALGILEPRRAASARRAAAPAPTPAPAR
jgi:Glycosyltransferase family 87